MATVDSDGDVVNTYTYDVFGATRAETGSQANEFQFAGEQVDGSTELQYLRARYYDMETGRFISREPLMDVPGWSVNPYGYGFGCPTRYADPSGFYPVDSDGKRNCSDDEKGRLLERIVTRVTDLMDRYVEFHENKWKFWGDRRQNYKDTFYQRQRNLKSWIGKWDRCNGGSGSGNKLLDSYIDAARSLANEYDLLESEGSSLGGLLKSAWGSVVGGFDAIEEGLLDALEDYDGSSWPVPIPGPGPVPVR